MWLLTALWACESDPEPTDDGHGVESDVSFDTGPTVPSGFGDRRLVLPTADGLELRDADGSLSWSRTWTELVGPCEDCGGEGASADGDGLLLALTTAGFQGAVARIDPAGLDFRLEGFDFPHDAIRDPLDGTIVVPLPTAGRVTWIAGDGSSATPLRILDVSDEGWSGGLPNGAERFDHDGHSYLLLSHRGISAPGSGSTGRLSLWDIGTLAPTRVWQFPAVGNLDMPHGAVFRRHAGRWWLLYAHTFGAGNGGSVGLAVTDDPAERPAYVADLVPPDSLDPFAFLRGVELDDGTLYLTDSGSQTIGGIGAQPTGRLVRARFPSLAPTGATGGVDADQVRVPLEEATVLVGGLHNPFEGWLWANPFPL